MWSDSFMHLLFNKLYWLFPQDVRPPAFLAYLFTFCHDKSFIVIITM